MTVTVYKIYKFTFGFENEFDFYAMRMTKKFVFHYDEDGCILVGLTDEQYDELSPSQQNCLKQVTLMDDDNQSEIIEREKLTQSDRGIEYLAESIKEMVDEGLPDDSHFNLKIVGNVPAIRRLLRSIDKEMRKQLLLSNSKCCVDSDLIFDIVKRVPLAQRREVLIMLVLHELKRYFSHDISELRLLRI